MEIKCAPISFTFIGAGWILWILALQEFVEGIRIWLWLSMIVCTAIGVIAALAWAMELRKERGILECKYSELSEDIKKYEVNMEKIELQREITKLKARIIELERELEKETDPTEYEFWKPSEEDTYYVTDLAKECYDSFESDGYIYDIPKYKSGFIYKTEEQAKHEAKCIKYKHMYRRYIQEHTEPLDWEDVGQRKYNVYWNYGAKCFEIGLDGRCKYAGKEYASSEQIIRDAIQFVGEDNFKKYVLEIEE